MHIKHLSLTNFRAFSRLDINLPKGIVLIVGQNAQGKTSLLESIFFLATFTSFHAQNDRQVINFLIDKEPLQVARIVADIQHEHSHQKMEIRVIQEPGRSNRCRKEVLVDGAKRSMQTAIGGFNAVIFLPQMTRVIENSPEERRRYLNLLISQIMPGYARALSGYSRALDQRNALLKSLAVRSGDPNELDYWDHQLAANGSVLIAARQNTVRELESQVHECYQHITRKNESLKIRYIPAFSPSNSESDGQLSFQNGVEEIPQQITSSEIEEHFLRALNEQRKNDIQRGVTTIGPHRDELRFLSNHIDLGMYGSRGQIRTTLLALKMAEVDWMKSKTSQTPVLLLDEVLAELDVQRRADLLGYLHNYEQALLTTTDLHLFPDEFLKQCTILQIEGGIVTPLENRS